MKQFKYNPSSFNAIRKRSLSITIPSLVVVFFLVLFTRPEGPAMMYLLAMVIGAAAFGIYRSLKQQKRMFESFTITIDESAVQRDQLNTVTVRIPKEQVTKIVKSPNGSLEIVGTGRGNVIVVPGIIEDRDGLESLLSAIHQITPQQNVNQLRWFPWLILGGTLVLMGIFFRSTNRLLGIVSGTLLVLEMIWGFYVIRSSKQVDNKTKRLSWWIILVIISFSAMVYGKIIGG